MLCYPWFLIFTTFVWTSFPPKFCDISRESKRTRDESCQRISPSLQFFFNNTRRSIEATFFPTMAWRSSGDTNDELVRNLKREFTPTLCVTPAPGIESFSHARKSRFDSSCVDWSNDVRIYLVLDCLYWNGIELNIFWCNGYMYIL